MNFLICGCLITWFECIASLIDLFTDKNEEAKLEEWRNTAKRELEEWYARQAEQVEKHKKNNRSEPEYSLVR